MWKTDVLANRLFCSVGVEIEPFRKELTDRTVRKLLSGSDIVIDTFDNSDSRALVQRHCRATGLQCLHVGLFENYGEVVWDSQYRVPADIDEADACDYPVARNLVLITVSVAAESLIRFALDAREESWSITLGDSPSARSMRRQSRAIGKLAISQVDRKGARTNGRRVAILVSWILKDPISTLSCAGLPSYAPSICCLFPTCVVFQGRSWPRRC